MPSMVWRSRTDTVSRGTAGLGRSSRSWKCLVWFVQERSVAAVEVTPGGLRNGLESHGGLGGSSLGAQWCVLERRGGRVGEWSVMVR
jgi:hypothetical protein